MLIDITLPITTELMETARANEAKAFSGHLGTHFDVMDKSFPLEYTRRNGIFFDVSSVSDREIDPEDIAMDEVQADMFVGFYTGFIEKTGYGNRTYFKEHPQLSNYLIEALVDRRISIIGIDFAGVRRGKQHTPMDQYCADHGVFVVENLCHLKDVCGKGIVHTYPMPYVSLSGLPCRVIVER